MSAEIEKPVFVIETPAQVNDEVWFIADDELYGGMSFSGFVTEVTLTSVKVWVEAPMEDTWTLPLSWFNEDKAFTSELKFVESVTRSWMEEALKEKRKNRELEERLQTAITAKNEAERQVANLEFELSVLRESKI
jgi:hypothetical protein